LFNFIKKVNNIEILNAMKLDLGIQGINTQSYDHSKNQSELNIEKVEMKCHSSQGHNFLLYED